MIKWYCMKKSCFLIATLLFIFSFTAISEGKFDPQEMVIIPKSDYIIGQGAQSYTSERTVNEFSIAKYETIYALWFEILSKAEKAGYIFQNPGQEGSEGKRGYFPIEENYGQPVTMINWYDAIVWCNAYSEISGLTPCYTYKNQIIRDSTNTAMCDLSECNFFCDGYRLPTEAEWELAARWHPDRENEKNNVIVPGDSISYSDLKENSNNSLFAWTSEYTDRSHKAGTTGTVFNENNSILPGTGYSNAAGIFDMTGNLLEYCWDWYANYEKQEENKIACGPEYGSKRISRGGSWSPYTVFDYTGDRYSFDPNECYNYMGFRVVQSR